MSLLGIYCISNRLLLRMFIADFTVHYIGKLCLCYGKEEYAKRVGFTGNLIYFLTLWEGCTYLDVKMFIWGALHIGIETNLSLFRNFPWPAMVPPKCNIALTWTSKNMLKTGCGTHFDHKSSLLQLQDEYSRLKQMLQPLLREFLKSCINALARASTTLCLGGTLYAVSNAVNLVTTFIPGPSLTTEFP